MNITKPTGTVRVILTVLSVLLCILLFASTIAAILIADVRVLTTKDNLKTLIDSTFFERPTVRTALPAAGAVGIAPRFSERAAENNEAREAIIQMIYDILKEQFGDRMTNISIDTVRTFLDESTLSDFLSDKIASIISDIYVGEVTTTLTADEINAQLTANASVIKSSFGYTLTEADNQVIVRWVEENDIMAQVRALIEQSISGTTGGDASSGIIGGVGDDSFAAGIAGLLGSGGVAGVISAVRTVTSVSWLVGAIALCVILLGLLFLTNWGRFHNALISGGIAIFAAAVPFLLAGIVPSFIGGVAGTLITQVVNLTGFISIITAVLGALLVAGGVVMAKLEKKNA